MKDLICLDCETTGLDPNADEILTLSIIGADGSTLFDETFRPVRKTEWPQAEAVNGISPESVAGCRPIYDYLGEIQAIFDSTREILGYNVEFDLGFIAAAGIDLVHPDDRKAGIGAQSEDAVRDRMAHRPMQDFAEVYGEWNPRRADWRWKKLTFAADHIGYAWEGRAHGSLADAKATLALAEWLYDEGNLERARSERSEARGLDATASDLRGQVSRLQVPGRAGARNAGMRHDIR